MPNRTLAIATTALLLFAQGAFAGCPTYQFPQIQFPDSDNDTRIETTRAAPQK